MIFHVSIVSRIIDYSFIRRACMALVCSWVAGEKSHGEKSHGEKSHGGKATFLLGKKSHEKKPPTR